MTGTRIICKKELCEYYPDECNFPPHFSYKFPPKLVDGMWEADCIDFKTIITKKE